MTQIRREIQIERPPEDVFGVLADLDGLPRWATIVVETRNVPDHPLRAGDTFEQTVRVAGINLDSEWTVVRADAPAALEYRATGPAGATLHMKQDVAPAAGGSRVAIEVDYRLPAGFLGELLDELYVQRRNEREAEASLQNLKDLLEGRTPTRGVEPSS